MKNWSIGRQIACLSGLMVALALLTGAIGLYGTRQMGHSVRSILDDFLPGTVATTQLRAVTTDLHAQAVRQATAADPIRRGEAEADINRLEGDAQLKLSSYQRTADNEQERELFRKLKDAFDRYQQSLTQLRALGRQGHSPDRITLQLDDEARSYRALQETIEAAFQFDKQQGDSYFGQASDTVDRTSFWIKALFAVAFLSSGLAVLLIRHVNRSLRRVADELTASATQVDRVSAEVEEVRQSMAAGATEQAASLEETSAASQQIHAMSKSSTERAQMAAAVAVEMAGRVEESNRSLSEMLESMRAINSASDRIAQIIKTIDEIAFQTNILALNAAVEAARAGQAGLGFAVVAEEVRSLAQRSAEAARSTATLINEAGATASAGQAKLDEVAASIRRITAGATEVKVLVDEVSRGGAEQSLGVEQISQALVQLEQVTHRNAAGADQGATASRQLRTEAASLQKVIADLHALV